MVNPLGSELRELRVARGLTLAQAAAQGGTTTATVSRWESGQRTPRARDLKAYLTSLGASTRQVARLLASAAHPDLAAVPGPLGNTAGLGPALRALRARRRMTQAELARAAGATQSAVAKWESGDSLPSTDTVHALGYALGATAEETIALASLQGGHSYEEWADPDRAFDRVQAVLQGSPHNLHLVLLRGFESEAWRRAVRDSRWDPLLLGMMSQRSAVEYYTGQPGLGRPTAVRALQMATPSTIRPCMLHALDTAWVVGQGRGADPRASVEMADRFVQALPESAHRGWALWLRAKGLVALGRHDEALASTERGIAEHSHEGYNRQGYAWMGIAARVETRLAMGDAPGALDAIDENPWEGDHIYCVRAHHANGIPVPEEWMHAARRYYAEWGGGMWLGRYRLKQLEDRQENAKPKRSSRGR